MKYHGTAVPHLQSENFKKKENIKVLINAREMRYRYRLLKGGWLSIMRTAEDLTGKRFGKLVVVKRVHPKGHRSNTYWLCKCDCGEYTIASSGNLKGENTKSCGCISGRRPTRWTRAQAYRFIDNDMTTE